MLLLATLSLAAVTTALNPLGDSWASWKVSHNRTYTPEQEARRFAVFVDNAVKVAYHNADASHGWTMHLNRFADLTEAEFAEYLGLKPKPKARQTLGSLHTVGHVSDVPVAIDWREKNVVTGVKNQGSCGSCWAYSTVVSIEGQQALKSNAQAVSLSEQNLVDCVKNINLNNTGDCCDGCKGGLMDDAFDYILTKQAGGIDTEASYSYTGSDGTCSFSGKNVGATITGFKDVKAGSEDALKDAVGTVGPISVGVDANIGWQLYHSGVMSPLPFIGCSSKPSKMDHGVAVVGYGSDSGKGYWIVKNSWGASWGEKGYVRLIQGKNACGVANSASYPTM